MIVAQKARVTYFDEAEYNNAREAAAVAKEEGDESNDNIGRLKTRHVQPGIFR